MSTREPISTTQLLDWPSPYNPRVMSEFMFGQLKKSIEKHGLVQEIVVNQRTEAKGWPKDSAPTTVGGHQRVRAAAAVGLMECDVRWVDLIEADERELNLQLNQIDGDFERDLLEVALRELEAAGGSAFDAGFTKEQVAEIYGVTTSAPEDFTDADPDVNRECPKCGYKWKE